MGFPMRDELKAGDHVRLTSSVRGNDYRPGQRGIVLSGDRADDTGWISYYVRLEGQPVGAWVRLSTDEIERDGAEEGVAENVGRIAFAFPSA
jgi:hypothetical protein